MKLLPSLMCLDFSKMATEVEKLENAAVDGYHIDVMDGHFVKNFGLGQQDVQAVKKLTKKPLDIHLMTEKPYEFIDYFDLTTGDMVHIHPETDPEPSKTIQKLHAQQLKASIVLSPSYSLSTIQAVLPIVDAVLVMTVNLGFSGQKYLTYVDPKIDALVAYRQAKKLTFDIYTDGALSAEKINQQAKIGVDGFVLGTSALFNKARPYAELITQLRNGD